MKRYLKISPGHVSGRILLKSLIFLSAALLVTSCGEKSSSEGFDSAGASAEPSADAVKPVPTESPGKEPSPPSLSDADVERLLKEAFDFESVEERDGLIYQDNKPYSGWLKEMYASGQVQALGQVKDGKPVGLGTNWHKNGQKAAGGTFKDGKLDGPYTNWHENGWKMEEGTFKDGKAVDGSAKYWNSKGEQVDTPQEALE